MKIPYIKKKNNYSFKSGKYKGPYIKYVAGEGGGGDFFVWVMKYFRHILMGNEIFSKLFDGRQNIF